MSEPGRRAAGHIADRLLPDLGPSDDPDLWRLVAAALADQAEGLMTSLEPRPRRVVVTFAAIPRRHPHTHPDDGAVWRRSFALERAAAGWSDEGRAAHVRRKRGHHWVTACVPVGTRRLAAAEVVCLWRPVFPWATPQETDVGRETRLYLRGAGGAWEARGVR